VHLLVDPPGVGHRIEQNVIGGAAAPGADRDHREGAPRRHAGYGWQLLADARRVEEGGLCLPATRAFSGGFGFQAPVFNDEVPRGAGPTVMGQLQRPTHTRPVVLRGCISK